MMSEIKIAPNLNDVFPNNLKKLSNYHSWKYSTFYGDKPVKTPINVHGYAVGYNNPSLTMSFSEALTLAKNKDWGLGITLNDGLYIDALHGYLWCFDFDGFAELNGNKVDHGVKVMLDQLNSYTEMSPSGTGFKVFLVSNMKPCTKKKILFSESSFLKQYPDIDKYRNRAIEIFSQNLFLTITGELFAKNQYQTLRSIDQHELEKIITFIDQLAIKDGGLGLNKEKALPPSPQIELKHENKLTRESILLLLSFINADDEGTWSDVANALSRVYGEEARPYFHEYSQRSKKYDVNDCDKRYSRALSELRKHPEGVGIKRLIELAKVNPKWNNPKLCNENDKTNLLNPATIKKRAQGITASELSKKTFSPLMWIVQDILPEGCYILSARPKVGKSWLALQVSLAVAFGGRTLGKNVVTGKAIYLALEDNQRRLQSRLELLKPDGYATENLLLYTEWPNFDNQGLENLIDLIIKEEPKLVVIDTLAKVRPPSRNNHAYENDYKTLAPLTAIANQYRLCILIVTHNRKGKSENDALEQVSGTLGLTGAVDGALVIDGIRTDKQYTLSLIGRDIPNDDELAIERKKNGEWQILGNASQVFISAERKEILDLLYMHPGGLKPKDIADHLDKRSGTVRKLLLNMHAGLQVINDNGLYKHPAPIGIASDDSNVGNSGNSSLYTEIN